MAQPRGSAFFPHLDGRSRLLTLHVSPSPSATSLLSFPVLPQLSDPENGLYFQGFTDCIGPPQASQSTSPPQDPLVTPAKSPLSCHLTLSQVLGTRRGHLWWPFFCSPHHSIQGLTMKKLRLQDVQVPQKDELTSGGTERPSCPPHLCTCAL